MSFTDDPLYSEERAPSTLPVGDLLGDTTTPGVLRKMYLTLTVNQTCWTTGV